MFKISIVAFKCSLLCGVTLFSSHQLHLGYLLPFVKVWLGSVCSPPCATPDNEAERRIYGGWVKTGFILAVYGPEFTQFRDSVWDSSCFLTSMPKNRTNVKVFGPNFCERRLRLLDGRLIARFTVCRFTKFGWVPFAWQWSGMQNLRRVGKNPGPILSRLWTKDHVVLRRYRRWPLVVCNAHFSDYVCNVSCQRYRAL